VRWIKHYHAIKYNQMRLNMRINITSVYIPIIRFQKGGFRFDSTSPRVPLRPRSKKETKKCLTLTKNLLLYGDSEPTPSVACVRVSKVYRFHILSMYDFCGYGDATTLFPAKNLL